MSEVSDLLAAARSNPQTLDHAALLRLLALESPEELQQLFAAAYAVKVANVGKKVHLRGLIEMGNICAKDCFYCGIRRSNKSFERYQLDHDAVIRMARWAFDQGYGSIALQSGEIESDAHTREIEDILREITDFSGGKLGITLSLGEQEFAVYEKWREAGAHRYLLRIETSDPELYARLHPADHSYARRRECLHLLRELDYQVGTGVMIGLPGQTVEHLAKDVEFFRGIDADMIGMGPYLPHEATPLGQGMKMTPEFGRRQLNLGLKMIAVTRLAMPDVNIAATTALQALCDDGREQGLLAGANVIMPNITDTEYRKNYQLYANKPCLEENSAQCRNCLNWRVLGIGEEIEWGTPGNPLHYTKRR